MSRYWHWLVLAAAGLGGVIPIFVSHHTADQLIVVGLSLILLVLQGRWPLLVGAVQIALYCGVGLIPGFTVSTTLIAMATLFDMNTRRPAWPGYVTAGGAAVVSATGVIASGSGGSYALSVVATMLFFAGGGITIRALLELQAQLRELSRLRLMAERQVMASEMHDVVAYGLSQVVLRARLAATRPGLELEAVEDLRGITDVATQSLGEVRSVISVLHSESDETALEGSAFDGAASGADLGQVEADLHSSGFDVSITTSGDVAGLPLVTRYLLSRTIRELAANVIRHADSSAPVTMDIAVDDQGVIVVTRNRIAASNGLPSSGLGLEGLRHRLDRVGGTLRTEESGGSWMTRVAIPRKANL